MKGLNFNALKNQLVVFLAVVSPFLSIGQTISGRIEGINGDKIPFAIVVAKDSVNAGAFKDFVIARGGMYSITIRNQYKQLILVVSANKYKKEILVIDSFSVSKNYTLDFTLLKDTIINLKEVVVTAKARPFQIKTDTVSFNVSAYRNGTERKIQDVIKKLPGIEVNEKTGEIKYKGKPVETVKLDGEDLFATNYAIGTKNINVDMIEQVQAIEKYSDNPLLKGIESDDKVALNLTLRRRKADYSGALDVGAGSLGSKAAIDVSTNILGISQKYKSFATISFNNVGVNNTPFDYFTYNPTVEELREAGLAAIKYIPDTYFSTAVGEDRGNINNAFFSSYNAVFKIGKRVSFKSNLYYFNDRITSRQQQVTANVINGQAFTTADTYSIIKKPVQVRSDLDVKYNISKRSLLEYSVQFKNQKINTLNDVLQNLNLAFKTMLCTKDDYFKQAVTYTVRLSGNQALQVNVKYAFNTVPQHLFLTPAIYDSVLYQQNDQASWFKKRSLLVQAAILGSGAKGKYSLLIGSTLRGLTYKSSLVGIHGSSQASISGFGNQFQYKQPGVYLMGNFKFQCRRLQVAPSIKLSALRQRLVNVSPNGVEDTAYYLIEPNLSLTYKAGNFSAFVVTAGCSQKPFSEEYFPQHPVYFSSRSLKENRFALQIQRTNNVGFVFLVNNLYRQFQLNICVNYADNRGNYFTDLLIQQNITTAVSFFLPEKASLFSGNCLVEKYIPFLQGTVRLRNDYTRQFYKNIVNGSMLRRNVSEIFSSSLFFKTAFDNKFNFENLLSHRYCRTVSEARMTFKNQSVSNNFKLIVKPAQRMLLVVSMDYYLPNAAKATQGYLFIDADVSCKTKSKMYDFRLGVRNVSGTNSLNQVDVTDYAINSFETNLLPRQIVLSASRSF